MIRIAFPAYNTGWTGGINYIRNLLIAISGLEQRRIEPFVLAGYKADSALLSLYEPYARIIQARMFDEYSFSWFRHQVQERFFGVDTQLENLILKHRIDILSHYPVGLKSKAFYRTIGWIPDFQHLHLPEMFSAADIAGRNLIYTNIAERCDAVVLSSNDAFNDFLNFAPCSVNKARILPFVAQPDMTTSQEAARSTIENKYDIRGKFFYVPNQFWKHKNHLVVFEAVKLLKQRGCHVTVLCSGHMEDYRNRGHVKQLVRFVDQNSLAEQIRFLGVIDYCDLTWLMRNCIAIINPSLFEGWSTTVEEAKSIGKGMILSDIQVHREQNPPKSVYFSPSDPDRLAGLLRDFWNCGEGGPDFELEAQAAADLGRRTLNFAQTYLGIVLEVEAGKN